MSQFMKTDPTITLVFVCPQLMFTYSIIVDRKRDGNDAEILDSINKKVNSTWG